MKVDFSLTTIAEVCVTISGWLAAVFVWLKWLYELREKRLEKEGKHKAEAELKEIRRRGSAPFLRPDNTRFNHIYHDKGNGKIGRLSPFDTCTLGAWREEVQLEEGASVFFVVENSGEAARSVAIKLDGDAISIQKEADMQDAHGFQFLVYPYCKAKHGKEQEITIAFESSTGLQDVHRYTTKHGFRVLRRIDPQLP